MVLDQFRVRVFITVFVLGFASVSLLFDLPLARRYAPYLAGLITGIIGWWMPSPGNVPPDKKVNIDSEKADILIEDK